jgi:hypothetical protein
MYYKESAYARRGMNAMRQFSLLAFFVGFDIVFDAIL